MVALSAAENERVVGAFAQHVDEVAPVGHAVIVEDGQGRPSRFPREPWSLQDFRNSVIVSRWDVSHWNGKDADADQNTTDTDAIKKQLTGSSSKAQ